MKKSELQHIIKEEIFKIINESTSDEAWELVGQKDSNISKIVP